MIVEPKTQIPYTSEAFITAFTAEFFQLGTVSVNLETGEEFSLEFDTTFPNVAVVQYGVRMTGPVADPETVDDLGKLVLEPSKDTIGL